MSDSKIENCNILKILFILFILVNLTTSLLTNNSSPSSHKLFDDAPIISIKDANHKAYFKNVPIHSISIANNDHNFESIESKYTNQQSSILSFNPIKTNNLIKQQKRALNNQGRIEKDNLSKVFSQTSKTDQKMSTNLDVKSFETALNSTNLLVYNDTFVSNVTDLLMSVSSKSPFLSSSLTNNTAGPDEIYVTILGNTRFWVQRVASPLVILIGVIGNSMTIVIMTRKRMRSSTNVYLAALATVDMLYLTFTFILSLKHYPGIKYASATPITRIYWTLLPIFMMTADACTNISVSLTVAFTIERFIVVSNPIRGKMICTESRARYICFSIFAVCTAFVIPVPFEWIIVEKANNEQNQTFAMEPSELGLNSTYKSVYYWLTSVLFIFIPLILLIVFNSFLIRSVQKSVKERQRMTNTQTKKPDKKQKKAESKQAKSKQQEFICKLQSDANNNDNTTRSTNKTNNLELNIQPANSQPNGQQQTNSSSVNDNHNLKPNKNLLQTQQRRPSDNTSLESRRTSASSPTAVPKNSSAITPNRIEQQSAKQEIHITIMLISVVILFLVCQVPVAINLIYTSIRTLQPETNEMYMVTALNNILNLMVAVNSAGNFVLYCLLSKKYRITLIALFCPCFKPKRLRKKNAQATIYSTLTTNQYHSPSSTGFEKSPNRLNDLKRSNEHQIKTANKPAKANDNDKEEEIVIKEELSKQTDVNEVQLSTND